MHTPANIAEELGTSAVMVRRAFAALHRAGFIVQRKGPLGGARLNPKLNGKLGSGHSSSATSKAAREIGLGDVFLAVEPHWLSAGDDGLNAAMKRVRTAAIAAMNETTIAVVAKKMKPRPKA